MEEQIAKLQRLFPEVVSEGKIAWVKLQATLGDAVILVPERFSFAWSGKREATSSPAPAPPPKPFWN